MTTKQLHGLDPEVIALRRSLADVLPSLTPRPSRKTNDPLEAQCRLYLELLRWPAGAVCPRCDESDRLLWLEAREKWHCYGCKYQFSATARTLFHQSHLPLWKWFVSAQLMARAEHPVSALELSRLLGGSYKSYWFTAHRIRLALAAEAAPGDQQLGRPLRGRQGKYGRAYEVERRWRHLHRCEPDAFRRVLQRLLEGEHVSYRRLVDAGPRAAVAVS